GGSPAVDLLQLGDRAPDGARKVADLDGPPVEDGPATGERAADRDQLTERARPADRAVDGQQPQLIALDAVDGGVVCLAQPGRRPGHGLQHSRQAGREALTGRWDATR